MSERCSRCGCWHDPMVMCEVGVAMGFTEPPAVTEPRGEPKDMCQDCWHPRSFHSGDKGNCIHEAYGDEEDSMRWLQCHCEAFVEKTAPPAGEQAPEPGVTETCQESTHRSSSVVVEQDDSVGKCPVWFPEDAIELIRSVADSDDYDGDHRFCRIADMMAYHNSLTGTQEPAMTEEEISRHAAGLMSLPVGKRTEKP